MNTNISDGTCASFESKTEPVDAEDESQGLWVVLPKIRAVAVQRLKTRRGAILFAHLRDHGIQTEQHHWWCLLMAHTLIEVLLGILSLNEIIDNAGFCTVPPETTPSRGCVTRSA
jgi:hypothetical protein